MIVLQYTVLIGCLVGYAITFDTKAPKKTFMFMNIFTLIVCVMSIAETYYLECTTENETTIPFLLIFAVIVPCIIILITFLALSIYLSSITKEKKYLLKSIFMCLVFIILLIYTPELLILVFNL